MYPQPQRRPVIWPWVLLASFVVLILVLVSRITTNQAAIADANVQINGQNQATNQLLGNLRSEDFARFLGVFMVIVGPMATLGLIGFLFAMRERWIDRRIKHEVEIEKARAATFRAQGFALEQQRRLDVERLAMLRAPTEAPPIIVGRDEALAAFRRFNDTWPKQNSDDEFCSGLNGEHDEQG